MSTYTRQMRKSWRYEVSWHDTNFGLELLESKYQLTDTRIQLTDGIVKLTDKSKMSKVVCSWCLWFAFNWLIKQLAKQLTEIEESMNRRFYLGEQLTSQSTRDND